MKNICYPMGGVEYSTNEKVVGKWIDGKPIYQKSWIMNTNITAPYNTWADLPISSTEIQKLINGTIIDVFDDVGKPECGNIYNYLGFAMNRNGNKVGVISVRESGIAIGVGDIVTLQYTKATD